MNFKVIENYSYEDKFEDFSQDYNGGMTKKDLVDKYGITPSVWRDWKERLPTRPHYKRSGIKLKTPKIQPLKDWKIKHTHNGTVGVYRRWKGQLYSYGTYPSQNIAIMVQELLKDANWNVELAIDLVKKYAVQTSKNCLLPHIRQRDERMGWND